MDICDISDERIDQFRDDAIRDSQRKAASFIVGTAGDCDKCGESRPRLVDGWCCFCRDKYPNYRG